MFNDISDAMQNMWERYWNSMKTCHYMMVQIGNYIELFLTMVCMTLSTCAQRGLMLMQTTKQKVWNLAKQYELDDFIAKVAKAFPDAIEIVHVKSPRNDVWCYAGKRDNDGVQ